jgi:two-component sensor histidine kinase
MNDDAARVGKLLRQQAALASFGGFALRQDDLLKVLNEAARVCAEGLGVPFSKVCRYRAEENDLLVVAGFGWKDGVIGNVVSRADKSSPQGLAFTTGQPSICNDLHTNTDFKLPSFYGDHGIVSTIDVVIKGDDQPYGVLEIDNDEQHDYDQHDIDFLTGFANVLAEAVATAARTATLQTTVERMRDLVEDKDRLLNEQSRLLDQKQVMAAELQHRVRNNLQLVYGMLSKQLGDTADEVGRRGIRGIARRVSTLAQVYDHLLGNEMTRTTDFGSYVNSLCRSLKEIRSGAVTLACDCDALVLDLDLVTALGIIVAELVTNSYDHAFSGGQGTIAVSVRRDAANPDMANMIVSDNGTGLKINGEDKRHGLGLVRRLVEQIDGIATVATDRGTAWTVSFPTRAALGFKREPSAPTVRASA